MYDLIMDLVEYFGVYDVPTNFGEFIPWFVFILFGMELVLFVLDSLFYTIRTINRGFR